MVERFLTYIPERLKLCYPLAVVLRSPPCQGFSKANIQPEGGENDREKNRQLTMVGIALKKFALLYLVSRSLARSPPCSFLPKQFYGKCTCQ